MKAEAITDASALVRRDAHNCVIAIENRELLAANFVEASKEV